MNQAIAIIKKYEGCKLDAYVPPEGDKGGLAIGYGYTRPWVQRGCRISQEWAEQLLLDQVYELEEGLMRAIDEKVQLTLYPSQLSALASLVYNIGLGAFHKSTLLKKLNSGDMKGAAAEFERWNKAGGKVLPGLVRRRAEERKLFESVPVQVSVAKGLASK
jgi:lysozyme